MKKKALLLTMVLLIALMMWSCGSSDHKKEEDTKNNSTAVEETTGGGEVKNDTDTSKVKESNWKAPYRKMLNKVAAYIEPYSTGESIIIRAGITDINGDGVPEMQIPWQEGKEEMNMKFYTCASGKLYMVPKKNVSAEFHVNKEQKRLTVITTGKNGAEIATVYRIGRNGFKKVKRIKGASVLDIEINSYPDYFKTTEKFAAYVKKEMGISLTYEKQNAQVKTNADGYKFSDYSACMMKTKNYVSKKFGVLKKDSGDEYYGSRFYSAGKTKVKFAFSGNKCSAVRGTVKDIFGVDKDISVAELERLTGSSVEEDTDSGETSYFSALEDSGASLSIIVKEGMAITPDAEVLISFGA